MYGLTVRKTTLFIILYLLLNTIAIRAGTKYWLPTGSYFFTNQSHTPYITKGTVWFERVLSGSCVDFSVNPAKFLFSNIKPISVTEQFLSPADINPSKDNSPATACCSSSNLSPKTALIRQLSMMTFGLLLVNKDMIFPTGVAKADSIDNKGSPVKVPFVYSFYKWAFWILLSANIIAYIAQRIMDEREANRILNHHKPKRKE